MTQPLNVVMLGAPASGKGTQAERLARARGIPKISTGDILRDAAQAGTPLGLKAKALIDRGELVDDETMIGIVMERLDRPDTPSGFILDGFPRTVAQAEALDRMLTGRGPLIVVELWVPKEALTQRMEDRRVCSRCRSNADPEGPANDTCARCGGKMVTRADDGDATVRLHRLDVYSRESPPLLDFYHQRPTFRSVRGGQSPDQVEADLMAAIESMQSPSVGARAHGRASLDPGPSAVSRRGVRS
jgi:adenylate kinase